MLASLTEDRDVEVPKYYKFAGISRTFPVV